MADHDNPERLEALAHAVIDVWIIIQTLLTDLPIPISLPDLIQDGEAAAQSLVSLNQARALIEDEPISEDHRSIWDHLILDWFAAYEIAGVTMMAGPAPWRLDTLEWTIQRVATWLDMIESGELDDDQS